MYSEKFFFKNSIFHIVSQLSLYRYDELFKQNLDILFSIFHIFSQLSLYRYDEILEILFSIFFIYLVSCLYIGTMRFIKKFELFLFTTFKIQNSFWIKFFFSNIKILTLVELVFVGTFIFKLGQSNWFSSPGSCPGGCKFESYL